MRNEQELVGLCCVGANPIRAALTPYPPRPSSVVPSKETSQSSDSVFSHKLVSTIVPYYCTSLGLASHKLVSAVTVASHRLCAQACECNSFRVAQANEYNSGNFIFTEKLPFLCTV